LSIETSEDVRIELDVQEHQDVKYYVDVSTNVNDSLETNLLENVHELPIDLAKPTCGMQQVNIFLIAMQDAPFIVDL